MSRGNDYRYDSINSIADDLVARALAALVKDPSPTVAELARIVSCSPFHLSRRFRSRMGMSISAYRLRLRVHRAHARIHTGEKNLARLAAELGFADHSHMTRTMREQLGVTPTAIRLRTQTGSTD